MARAWGAQALRRFEVRCAIVARKWGGGASGGRKGAGGIRKVLVKRRSPGEGALGRGQGTAVGFVSRKGKTSW